MGRTLLLAAVGLAVAVAPGARAGPAAGPANTSVPTIAGTPRVNGTVSASPGTWVSAGGTITYAYAWEICDAAGASCQSLPYTTQTIERLSARVGGTIRVVVTATDATGSATATSAPEAVLGASAGGAATVTLLAPKRGAIVVGGTVKITVKVTGSSADAVTANHDVGNVRLRRGAHGTWSGRGRLRTTGVRTAFTVTAQLHGGGSASVHGWFRHYVSRYFTRPDLSSADMTLGCNPCNFADARGDAVGGGPDITRVQAVGRHGRVTVTITTANSWAGGTVCDFFHVPTPNPTARSKSGSIDCYGNKINNGGLDGDIPIAAPLHPNAHTTIVSFALAAIRRAPYLIRNPRYVLLGVWAHGNGDFLYDEFPKGTVAGGPMFKLQFRPDP